MEKLKLYLDNDTSGVYVLIDEEKTYLTTEQKLELDTDSNLSAYYDVELIIKFDEELAIALLEEKKQECQIKILENYSWSDQSNITRAVSL
jgi:uncharacterized protein with PIN domain